MIDRSPRWSRLRGGLHIGSDFFERIGATRADLPAPLGLVDTLEALARPELNMRRIDPAVVPFLLSPGALRLRMQSHWHGAFALAWWAMRPALGLAGQFHLPRERAVIDTRTHALDPARDGRPDVRGVIRSYVDGGVMQVVAYATHRARDAGYMSAAFPLPFGSLCGVLRLDVLDAASDGSCGMRLTSRRRAGITEPVGIWFAPRIGPAFPLPFEETLEFWGARSPDAPASLRDGVQSRDQFVGRHVQKFFGARFATHSYWFAPRVLHDTDELRATSGS